MASTHAPVIAEIVEDIIANISEAGKANVVNKSADDLILFHHGCGTYIRNRYNLWGNQALVKATGKEHPDDASMVIIKAVWQSLCDSTSSRRCV